MREGAHEPGGSCECWCGRLSMVKILCSFFEVAPTSGIGSPAEPNVETRLTNLRSSSLRHVMAMRCFFPSLPPCPSHDQVLSTSASLPPNTSFNHLQTFLRSSVYKTVLGLCFPIPLHPPSSHIQTSQLTKHSSETRNQHCRRASSHQPAQSARIIKPSPPPKPTEYD